MVLHSRADKRSTFPPSVSSISGVSHTIISDVTSGYHILYSWHPPRGWACGVLKYVIGGIFTKRYRQPHAHPFLGHIHATTKHSKLGRFRQNNSFFESNVAHVHIIPSHSGSHWSLKQFTQSGEILTYLYQNFTNI
jgi:hypothetical protein